VNGRDDDRDGLVDNGWDGMAHGPNGDIFAASETETWLGPAVTAGAYAIERQLAPGRPEQVVWLPVGIDVATSALVPNPLSGNVDIMVYPSGQASPVLPYSALSSIRMDQSRMMFNLIDSSGNNRSLTLWCKTGKIQADVTLQGSPVTGN